MEINIEQLKKIDPAQEDRLIEVWESAVRATHHFLEEKDIKSLKPFVRSGLHGNGELLCALNPQNNILAFLFAENDKIEMLFVHPDFRGMGLGRRLLEYALEHLPVQYVDVNEQNGQGYQFYEHLGFKVIGRSEKDAQGNPFPILHMIYNP